MRWLIVAAVSVSVLAACGGSHKSRPMTSRGGGTITASQVSAACEHAGITSEDTGHFGDELQLIAFTGQREPMLVVGVLATTRLADLARQPAGIEGHQVPAVQRRNVLMWIGLNAPKRVRQRALRALASL